MKISVVGGGSWGSAFALHLGRMGIPTRLWIREKEVYLEIINFKENKTFLPREKFPPEVIPCLDIKEAVQDSHIVFIAIPSQYCHFIYQQIKPFIASKQVLVSLTKGIENKSLMRMTEIIQEIFSVRKMSEVAVLSGPSFAVEVARKHPTAVVVASKSMNCARKIQHLISNQHFRAYTSTDIIGVEIAGAVKNVLAIATGISDGIEFGYNSQAALITRGLAEMTRLGVKLGAKPATFAGLAGVGDLVLTCTGKLSRNHSVGYEIGQGKSLEEIVSRMKMVAEGISTTLSVRHLAQREKVDMPICEQVFNILYNKKDPKQALQELMSRALKEE